MTRKGQIVALALAVTAATFLAWRLLRPLHTFAVADAFAHPLATPANVSPGALSAKTCGACHADFYAEWSTSMHARAWTDPYFQVDFRYDGSLPVCKNCHIPLDRQQEQLVLGFRDDERFDPILAPNPAFSPELQSEGVTCAACHLRGGQIAGPLGTAAAAHPVTPMGDPNETCIRCHVVGGRRWDAFYRLPPCGTVAEIRDTAGGSTAGADQAELFARDAASLGCVRCHMPPVERTLVPGGTSRPARRHWWRGGHSPDMVRSGLAVDFDAQQGICPTPELTLSVTNVGADHYLPTGTPDRMLTLAISLYDAAGAEVETRRQTLERTILWRPFIFDLWDTRLRKGQTVRLHLKPRCGSMKRAVAVEAMVRYHLVGERRRRKIGYQNNHEMVAFDVFRQRVSLEQGQPAPR
ncbi:MAG: hypothetical protein HYV63_29400 [Candidatus Schekmanbacteria bacterium]|nr:hypothetical protein [Candidatus Schekmanbacteria bacterium]